MSSDDRAGSGWPQGRAGIVAIVATGSLLGLTTADLGQHYRIPLGGAFAMALARALGLALAWLRPAAAVPVSLVTTALTAAVTIPVSFSEPWPWPVTAVLGQSAVLAVIGARGASRRGLVFWWIVTQLLGVAAMALAPQRGTWSGLLAMAVFSGIAVVVADLLRSRGETRHQLAEQQGISAAERAQRARWQERARIARELHDVVAHHLSVVVVRADSAPHRLHGLPDEVRDEFAGIAEDARSSLTEMRRVLRLLRQDPVDPEAAGSTDERAELVPQPGLDHLDVLVATTRRAGADVRLEADVPAGLDPAIELTAYRVVQEAISNAVRHAPRATVRVAVRGVGSDLRITVANGPGRTRDRPLSDARESGHGLVGMRERIGLVDGTFQAASSPDGGYLVEALIPLAGQDRG